MTKKAAVLLADGFEEIEAVTPVDILRRAGVDTVVAGVTGSDPTGSHGIRIHADLAVADLGSDLDLVVLPGGMPGAKHLGASREARNIVGRLMESERTVAAICAAPVHTLSAWGFLSGRRATCYPGMEGEFAAGVAFVADSVVRDGNIVTGRGVGAALDFSLALIAILLGEDAAAGLADKTVAAFATAKNVISR